jgi:hypothetical protein
VKKLVPILMAIAIALIAFPQKAHAYCSLDTMKAFSSGDTHIEISPAAFVGCRSPEEPGCATCYSKQGDRCIVREWQPGGADVTGITPWYNAESYQQQCPENVSPCASCLRRSEEELRYLLARGQTCECASLKIPPDACFYSASCECYCEQWESLKSDCPYTLKLSAALVPSNNTGLDAPQRIITRLESDRSQLLTLPPFASSLPPC